MEVWHYYSYDFTTLLFGAVNAPFAFSQILLNILPSFSNLWYIKLLYYHLLNIDDVIVTSISTGPVYPHFVLIII